MINVGVISLGCSKNQVDTEQMLGILKAAGGYRFVQAPEDADVLIVNTCGFIQPAKEESINAILEMARYKETGSCKALVVTGCLSQRYREELTSELPEVDILLGVREYETLPEKLAKVLGKTAPKNDYRCAPRVLTTPPYSAYLRVGDGCSNRCAYCAIPLIRGDLVSTPMEELLEEAHRLTENGVKELTIIAQDTSGYGVERYGKPMLLPLMEKLCDIKNLEWLRLLYTYPDTVTPELVETMAGLPKVCNYLDLPLQHIHDDMLHAMRRRGSSDHIKSVLRWIRHNAPDFMLRTTMMVGFPGETETHFQTMLDFLQEYPFDRVGAFAFSPEDGTPAADMPDQVEEALKEYRLHTLMELQAGISKARSERRIGSTCRVLVEGQDNGLFIGRSYAEAPEVDGKILFTAKTAPAPGSYVNVKLTRAGEYDMWGEEV